jgi:hypothetical protein
MREIIDLVLQGQEQSIAALTKAAGLGLESTQKCFEICNRAWGHVKKIVRNHGFTSDTEEIEFFKTLKPKFTGPLEFYLLLFRYRMFESGDPAVFRDYCENELRRLADFRKQHGILIDYCEQGRTDWDAEYFLHRNLQRRMRRVSQMYDRAIDLWTTGDWIVTTATAHKLLEPFLLAAAATRVVPTTVASTSDQPPT